MNTRLQRQLDEEAVVQAYIEKRDGLSREVGQLQSTLEAMITMKSCIEKDVVELKKEKCDMEYAIVESEETMIAQNRAWEQKHAEIERLKKDQVDLEKAISEKTLEWRSVCDNTFIADAVLEEVSNKLSEKERVMKRKIDTLSKEIAVLENVRDSKQKEFESWTEEMEKKDSELVEREARVEERMAQASQKEEDTNILRRRLAKLAEENGIHFSIKL